MRFNDESRGPNVPSPTPFTPATRVIAISAIVLNVLFIGVFFLRVGLSMSDVALSPWMQWFISDTNYPYQVLWPTGTVALVLDYVGLVPYFFQSLPLLEASAFSVVLPLMFYWGYKVCG